MLKSVVFSINSISEKWRNSFCSVQKTQFRQQWVFHRKKIEHRICRIFILVWKQTWDSKVQQWNITFLLSKKRAAFLPTVYTTVKKSLKNRPISTACYPSWVGYMLMSISNFKFNAYNDHTVILTYSKSSVKYSIIQLTQKA